MEKTTIKNIFDVTKLGFGAWAIGGGSYGHVDHSDATSAIDRYIAEGGNFIDTAEIYGQSEEILGEYLEQKGIKNDVVIATKSFAGSELSTVADIETALLNSLRKLRREYVDIFYLHNPPEDDETINEALTLLEKFKSAGKIRAIGASIKGVDVTDSTVSLSKKYIDTGRVDVLQLVYSIFRQKNHDVFDYALQHNVGIVARTSLESGFLTGKFSTDHKFVKGDHRNRWVGNFEYIADSAKNLSDRMFEKDWEDSLLSLALRFTCSPTAVTSTIVGAKDAVQMDEIIKAYKKGSLPGEVISELKNSYYRLNNSFNTK